jgi:hypothetical protein
MRQRGRPRTAPAQDRARDWTADVPALLEVVLRDAAKGVVSAGEGEAAPADVLQRVLMQRNQMAHDLVAGLQRSLGRTLESVQQALPLAEPSSTVRDLAFRGLPAPDLSALRPRLKASRPWCAALLPDVAAWLTRRDLQGRLGPEIREQLALHDRQLQAWLRASLGQLIEAYEAQAEVYREHWRRLTDQGPSGGAESPSDRQSLEEDLRALRQTEEAPPATPPGGEPGGAETGRGDANDPTRLGIG